MLVLPLRIRRLPSSVIITDARGRAICIYCEEAPLRRDVACLWSPSEAEALARWIARRLTDQWDGGGCS